MMQTLIEKDKSTYIIESMVSVPNKIKDTIDVRIKVAEVRAYERVKRQKALHRGNWLTLRMARKFERLAWPYLAVNGRQYIGYVKELGERLQSNFGVTEIEAINILNGNHIREYVERYYRIENLIPQQVNYQEICDEVLWEYGMIK